MLRRTTQRAVAASLALLGLTFIATTAAGFVFVTTPHGTPVTWRQRCVSAWLHTEVPPVLTADDTYDALDHAVAAWNAIACTWLRGAERGFTCFDDVGLSDWPGAQDVILWRTAPTSWEHAYRVVALTSVTYDKRNGEIVDADIEMNSEDYLFATDGQDDAYDLQQTLTHELGHIYGLDHSEKIQATMYALSFAGELSKRTLDADDVEGLCTSHPMSTAPAGGQCQAALAAPIDAPWCPAAPAEEGCAGGATGTGPWGAVFVLALLALMAMARRVGLRSGR